MSSEVHSEQIYRDLRLTFFKKGVGTEKFAFFKMLENNSPTFFALSRSLKQ